MITYWYHLDAEADSASVYAILFILEHVIQCRMLHQTEQTVQSLFQRRMLYG